MRTEMFRQALMGLCENATKARKTAALLLDYIEMLSAELEETAPLAAMRGWKSSRIEEGRRLREALGVEEGKDKP